MRNDLSGQTFGHWKVIGSEPVKWRGTNELMWKCECDCGTVKFVNAWSLTAGKSTNCGCVRNPCEGKHQRVSRETFQTLHR